MITQIFNNKITSLLANKEYNQCQLNKYLLVSTAELELFDLHFTTQCYVNTEIAKLANSNCWGQQLI